MEPTQEKPTKPLSIHTITALYIITGACVGFGTFIIVFSFGTMTPSNTGGKWLAVITATILVILSIKLYKTINIFLQETKNAALSTNSDTPGEKICH